LLAIWPTTNVLFFSINNGNLLNYAFREHLGSGGT
jgi:hypothetical protein